MYLYLMYYIIIAFSFSVSSTYTIHYLGLKEIGVTSPISYCISFLLLSFIIFPVVLMMWLKSPEHFKRGYTKEIKKYIEKEVSIGES